MTENNFFAICLNDGCTEWYELYEDDAKDFEYSEKAPVANYLQSDGSVAHKNEFIRGKDKKYRDVVCSWCEAPMVLIPFNLVTQEERKNVFAMEIEDKIQFAKKYQIVENLDD